MIFKQHTINLFELYVQVILYPEDLWLVERLGTWKKKIVFIPQLNKSHYFYVFFIFGLQMAQFIFNSALSSFTYETKLH